jgi:hypothetical protein
LFGSCGCWGSAASRPLSLLRRNDISEVQFQHHLETFLAEAQKAAPMGWGVPSWVERNFRCRDPGVGEDVADALRQKGFGVTEFHGQGRQGRVDFLYTLVKRRQIPEVIAEVERWDQDAFITVEEPRTIRRGWMFTRRRK